MPTLHIFNPETDCALASGRPQYTPPKNVVKLRRMLAAIPALWAEPGDDILMLDTPTETPYSEIAAKRGINMITPDQLSRCDITAIDPWGWNLPLAQILRRHGLDSALIPGNETLARFRQTSHRRTTIAMHRYIDTRAREGSVTTECPVEISDTKTLREWLSVHPDSYLKAPWSSSGRGVIHTSIMRPDAVIAWGDGIIRSQGSLLAEKGFAKTADFASLWVCSEGKARFAGMSMFTAADNGRYAANISDTEEKIRHAIAAYANLDDSLLTLQQEALDLYVAPYYSGPCGIDMLATADGRINACVEVNLRRTMGFAAAALYRLTGRPSLFTPVPPSIG